MKKEKKKQIKPNKIQKNKSKKNKSKELTVTAADMEAFTMLRNELDGRVGREEEWGKNIPSRLLYKFKSLTR